MGVFLAALGLVVLLAIVAGVYFGVFAKELNKRMSRFTTYSCYLFS